MTDIPYENVIIGCQDGDEELSPVVAHMINRYASELGREESDRLLEPLAERCRKGGPTTRQETTEHGRMAASWLINTLIPAALETVDGLEKEAEQLRQWSVNPRNGGVELYQMAGPIEEKSLEEMVKARRERQLADPDRWHRAAEGRLPRAYRILSESGHGAAIQALWAAGEAGLLSCGTRDLTGAALNALTGALWRYETGETTQDKTGFAGADAGNKPESDPGRIIKPMRESFLNLLSEMTRPPEEEPSGIRRDEPLLFQGREICRKCVQKCMDCRSERVGTRTWTHGGAHLLPCGRAGHSPAAQ